MRFFKLQKSCVDSTASATIRNQQDNLASDTKSEFALIVRTLWFDLATATSIGVLRMRQRRIRNRLRRFYAKRTSFTSSARDLNDTATDVEELIVVETRVNQAPC